MQILIKKYNLQYTIPEKIMELSKKIKQNWTDSKKHRYMHLRNFWLL